MKIIETLLKNIHIFLLMQIAYTEYEAFEQHNIQVQNAKTQIPPIQMAIEKENEKINRAEVFKQNLEQSRNRVGEVEKQIEIVQKQLPNNISDPEILEFLKTKVQDLNMRDSFFQPTQGQQFDFYLAKRYEMKSVGTFLQTLIFFETLFETERLYNIKQLNLIRKKDGQKGRFQLLDINMILETFQYYRQ